MLFINKYNIKQISFQQYSMNTLQKQPICLTRLKKKSTAFITHQPAHNKNQEVCINLKGIQNGYSKYSQQNTHPASITQRNLEQISLNCIQEKKNYMLQTSVQPEVQENLRKQLKELYQKNYQLQQINEVNSERLRYERQQKNILQSRIQHLQESIYNLSSDLFENCEIHRTPQMSFYKIQGFTYVPLASKLNKPIKIETNRNTSNNFDRRLSLSIDTCIRYLPEDPSVKAREYKNQLEIQKLKRLNLQREIQNLKENCRIQYRNEIESLKRKLEQNRWIMNGKDKQVYEKQKIISHLLQEKRRQSIQ